jgi:hypothetical protein
VPTPRPEPPRPPDLPSPPSAQEFFAYIAQSVQQALEYWGLDRDADEPDCGWGHASFSWGSEEQDEDSCS